MSCDDVRNELVAWLDGELSGEEGALLQPHVARCQDCARELRALERARGLIEEFSADKVLSGVSFEALWQRVHDSARVRSASPESIRRQSASAVRRAIRWSVPLGMAAAAGAALALFWEPAARGPIPPPVEVHRDVVKGAQGRQAEAASGAKPRVQVESIAKVETRSRSMARVPRELRDNPGLFVDYSIVRRLDELQHLDSVLSGHEQGRDAGRG
jgi:anti-sigma factor RsiW